MKRDSAKKHWEIRLVEDNAQYSSVKGAVKSDCCGLQIDWRLSFSEMTSIFSKSSAFDDNVGRQFRQSYFSKNCGFFWECEECRSSSFEPESVKEALIRRFGAKSLVALPAQW